MQAPTLHFLDNDDFLTLSRPAQQNPATGEYITDALGAVLTPLPKTALPEHHRWRLVLGAWVATQDHRGREGFMPDGTPCTVEAWGPLPDGWTIEKPYVPPTPKQIEAQYTAAAQAYLDDFARTKTYDGILSACTYASDPDSKLRAEGQRCVGLRSAVWGTAFTILNDIMDNRRGIPTIEQFISELPKLTWG